MKLKIALKISFIKIASRHGTICCALLLSLFLPRSALADLAFKKKIIESCDEAKIQLNRLEKSQQIAAVEDLRLVLNLTFSQIDSLSPDNGPNTNKIGAIHAPLEDLKDNDMWRVFQPSREVKAKRCALEIIKLLSPYSIDALPEMVKLTQDHTLPVDVQNMLYDAMNSILLDAAHDDSFTIPNNVIEQLINLLDDPQSFYATNALVELQKTSVDIMLKDLEKPDSKLRDNITSAMLKIDDKGNIIGQGVLKLLSSADDGLRKRAILLLSQLSSFYAFALPALLEKLSDLSPEVEESAFYALGIIFSNNSKLPAITIEKSSLDLLMKKFETADANKRKVLAQGLKVLGPLVPGFQIGLIKILDTNNEQLRAELIELLGSLHKLEPQALTTLLKALSDKNSAVRINAVQALSNQPESKEILSAFSKLLKSNASEKDPQVKQQILIQSAKAIARMKPASGANSFIVYFVPILQIKEASNTAPGYTFPAAQALIAIGADSIPSSLKALNSNDPLVRQAALTVIGEIKPSSRANINAIVQAIKDQDLEIRTLAESYVMKIGSAAIAPLNTILKSTNAQQRRIAAKLLIKLGVKDPSVTSVILESVKKDDCNEKAALVVLDPTIVKAYSEVVANALIACLANPANNGELTTRALEEIAPLHEASQKVLLNQLQQGQISKKTSLAILEKSIKWGLPATEIIPLLQKELSNEDKTVKFKTVSILGEFGPQAQLAIPDLINFIKDNSDDELLSNEAVINITKISPQAFDYNDFFFRKLESDNYQWAEKSLVKLDPTLALAVLERAMNELPSAKKQRAIAIGGNLGPIATKLAPQIAEFISLPDPQASYTATVALLKIDPMHSLAAPAFKKILSREIGQRLLNENFDSTLLPLIDKTSQGSASYVEKKLLQELSDKIAAANVGMRRSSSVLAASK